MCIQYVCLKGGFKLKRKFIFLGKRKKLGFGCVYIYFLVVCIILKLRSTAEIEFEDDVTEE